MNDSVLLSASRWWRSSKVCARKLLAALSKRVHSRLVLGQPAGGAEDALKELHSLRLRTPGRKGGEVELGKRGLLRLDGGRRGDRGGRGGGSLSRRGRLHGRLGAGLDNRGGLDLLGLGGRSRGGLDGGDNLLDLRGLGGDNRLSNNLDSLLGGDGGGLNNSLDLLDWGGGGLRLLGRDGLRGGLDLLLFGGRRRE